MTDAASRKPGRPAGSRTSDRTRMVRVRCSPEQEAAFEALGGADWLRAQLDRAGKRLARPHPAAQEPGERGG